MASLGSSLSDLRDLTGSQADMSVDPGKGSRDLIPRIWIPDPGYKTPYCVGIHRDPISDKKKLAYLLCSFFKRFTTFFIEI